MPAVSVMIKPASGMCNMECEYCFYCDETKNRRCGNYGFMSEQTLKNVIRKTMLSAEGSISYIFQGGEPTLCGLEFFEKALEYQKQYNRKEIRVFNSLQTNGYAIDERWCDFFRKNGFLIGVSVDGTRETHDAFRHSKSGGPTFERVRHTVELLERYGVEYNILTVVNKQVAANVDKIYAFYRECGWRYQQYIACLEPFGAVRGGSAYAVTPEEYGKFLSRLFELWYADYRKGKQPYIRRFENYIRILLGYLPEACDQRGKCSIQNLVEADGSVYPCDFYALDEYCLGNFNTQRMEEINQKREETGFIARSEKLSPACSACDYYSLCRGGCQRNRDWQETGWYENYFCSGYRLFFETCYSKMQQVADEVQKRGH